MKINTKWFGETEISEDKIFTFDMGIIGFEDCKKFTIMFDAEEGEDTPIVWLQSVDEAGLAIPIMRPEIVMENYDPIVEDELVKTLGEDIEHANLEVFVTMTVPSNIKYMTCNLKAPIILNLDTMKGIQIIADNEDYMVRYRMYDILEKRNRKEGK